MHLASIFPSWRQPFDVWAPYLLGVSSPANATLLLSVTPRPTIIPVTLCLCLAAPWSLILVLRPSSPGCCRLSRVVGEPTLTCCLSEVLRFRCGKPHWRGQASLSGVVLQVCRCRSISWTQVWCVTEGSL